MIARSRLTEAERADLRGLGQGQVPGQVESVLASRMLRLAERMEVVLAAHYPRGGWAPRAGFEKRPGRWLCGCGESGEVLNGEKVVGRYREHLAAVIAAEVYG